MVHFGALCSTVAQTLSASETLNDAAGIPRGDV
jgi:hypothetical protein